MSQGKIRSRDHDGFFRYVYSIPKNAKALLNICSKNNSDLDRILAGVNLDTLVRLPDTYSEVGERGEADIAFKAHLSGGGEINVGILLEHKSKQEKSVLNQVGRYALRVIMDHEDEVFSWIPTKAIIIYNGPTGWDPLTEFRKKARAKFQGNELPFECVLVNLAAADDIACVESESPAAAVGVMAMKYAFSPEGFKAAIPKVEAILRKMPSNEQATLIEKIILYLGEYIDESTVEELQMAWKSIGQRMGFVSAGDARRAAEKAGREEGLKKGLEEGLEKGFDNALDVMRKLGVPEEKIQEAKAMQEKASNN
ncbi:Rpn family recombination-promoting nuclease/putative transposase [Fibrobacter succinogenes]|uniref:Transposase, YhgA-like n=1 Tax=Fibrobacter succinogenes TaxID=833 RepID=A0A380S8T5_FIBSU|nr:Rpn family recombination-promoting nuclease/putative transposase [Fibrobacter succinogenes]PWJ34788.1 putative YhgA-like transposase [Fibrobacter succinogenes subsp. elongatus]SUQ24911.1 Putative transposase, YhgA-like [Fibrobacter succinogenes]